MWLAFPPQEVPSEACRKRAKRGVSPHPLHPQIITEGVRPLSPQPRAFTRQPSTCASFLVVVMHETGFELPVIASPSVATSRGPQPPEVKRGSCVEPTFPCGEIRVASSEPPTMCHGRFYGTGCTLCELYPVQHDRVPFVLGGGLPNATRVSTRGCYIAMFGHPREGTTPDG